MSRRKTPRPDADADVGYGRPPVHARFQPGRSGNPRGRPKGSKNFAKLFEAELNQVLVVAEEGVRRKRTKQEILIKQAVNRALALKHPSDLRPLLDLYKLFGLLGGPAAAPPTPAESAFGGEDDWAILRALLDRDEESSDEPV